MERDDALQYIVSSSNDELNQLVTAIKSRRKLLKEINTARVRNSIEVGDAVKFLHREHKDANEEGYIEGTLQTMKRTKCTVRTGDNNVWTLPISLLEAI